MRNRIVIGHGCIWFDPIPSFESCDLSVKLRNSIRSLAGS